MTALAPKSTPEDRAASHMDTARHELIRAMHHGDEHREVWARLAMSVSALDDAMALLAEHR